MVIAVRAHKIAYMALPKAACSSVKEALASVDPDVTVPPEAEIDEHTFHNIYPTQRFRPHRWEMYEDHFRFCVVRDPIKRLMSTYVNRVLHFGDLRNSIKIRDGRDYLPDGLPSDPDPDYFFQNLETYKVACSSIKHHACGAWLFLGRDLRLYDRVYRTDEMDDLAWDLHLLTRQKVTMPRRNASEMTLTLDDLQPGTIDALRPFLEQEYAFLADFVANPLR